MILVIEFTQASRRKDDVMIADGVRSKRISQEAAVLDPEES